MPLPPLPLLDAPVCLDGAGQVMDRFAYLSVLSEVARAALYVPKTVFTSALLPFPGTPQDRRLRATAVLLAELAWSHMQDGRSARAQVTRLDLDGVPAGDWEVLFQRLGSYALPYTPKAQGTHTPKGLPLPLTSHTPADPTWAGSRIDAIAGGVVLSSPIGHTMAASGATDRLSAFQAAARILAGTAAASRPDTASIRTRDVFSLDLWVALPTGPIAVAFHASCRRLRA